MPKEKKPTKEAKKTATLTLKEKRQLKKDKASKKGSS
jgi:hypothetical protein